MIFRKNFLIFCLVSLCIVMTTIHAKERSDFQKAISSYQEKYLTSATVLILKENTPIFNQEIGLANYTSKKTFTHDMPFPIASLSKQFTAAAILLLWEDGKLELDKPIIHYLNAGHEIWQGKVPFWVNEVTIHQLLTHSSGITSYTNEKIDNLETIGDEKVISYIISSVKDKPLRFNPGEKYEYNNTGFLLLSVIIKELSEERDFSQFLLHRIFSPLLMKDSFLPSLAMERELIKNINQDKRFPVRYIANLSNLNTMPIPMTEIHLELPLSGGGAIISTVNDLRKWNQGLYSGKVLSKKSLKLMTTPHITGEDSFLGPIQYGYGLFINNDNPENVIYSHSGWLQGVRTELSYASKSKTSVICFSNLSPDESQEEKALQSQVSSFHDLAKTLQNIAIKS